MNTSQVEGPVPPTMTNSPFVIEQISCQILLHVHQEAFIFYYT